MMAALKGWLLSVIGVSLACALADGLMPKGPVRTVGRLVCGLALAAAVLSPVVRLELEGGARWLEEYYAQVEQREDELKAQVDEGMVTIIEQKYAAYIVDKAAQLGESCTAQVTCKMENGLWIPERAEITGALSEQARAALEQVLREELGLAGQSQRYVSEEGAV